MLSSLRNLARVSSQPLLTRTLSSYSRTLSSMATQSSKPVVHYTAPTPNGIVPAILLEELKVRRALRSRPTWC